MHFHKTYWPSHLVGSRSHILLPHSSWVPLACQCQSQMLCMSRYSKLSCMFVPYFSNSLHHDSRAYSWMHPRTSAGMYPRVGCWWLSGLPHSVSGGPASYDDDCQGGWRQLPPQGWWQFHNQSSLPEEDWRDACSMWKKFTKPTLNSTLQWASTISVCRQSLKYLFSGSLRISAID